MEQAAPVLLHVAGSPTPRGRSRGGIEKLSSGALRAYVYDGLDPVSGRRHYLLETVPAGPEAQKLAEKALRRLTHQASAALATFGVVHGPMQRGYRGRGRAATGSSPGPGTAMRTGPFPCVRGNTSRFSAGRP